MLTVEDLSKRYRHSRSGRFLFEDLSFSVDRSERLALLGRNGQGKSTLIKILGGILAPSSGVVRWSMSASWPLAFTGAFQGGLTGIDNIRFLARLYDRPPALLIDKVERFAELGDALTMQVKHYSSGMRARLAFGLTLAIEFDCYLIDEVIAVGDSIFMKKCQDELFGYRGERAFIIASHDIHFLKETCNRAIIIDKGQFQLHDNMDKAVEAYEEICGVV